MTYQRRFLVAGTLALVLLELSGSPSTPNPPVLIDRLRPLAAEYYFGELAGGFAARPSPRGSEPGGLLPT